MNKNNYYGIVTYGAELSHHGIKGQKWGIRRFQNKDGSRTLLGKKRRQYYLDSTNRLRYDNDPEYRKSRKKYEKYARSNPHGYGDDWDEKATEFSKKVNNNRVTYSKMHYLDKGKLDVTETELEDQRRFNSTKDDDQRTARSTELVEKHQREINRISSKAHKLAMQEGGEAAAKYVMDALGNYDYHYVHEARNHIDTGVKQIKECLTVYGKNKTYNIMRENNSVSGDAAYSNYYEFGSNVFTDTKKITKKI